MMDESEKKSFWEGLLPKKETQALDFTSKYPTYDGRGVVVGILDTGVDPGCIGLSTTTDGKSKIIDIVDCSGSGDVAMGDYVAPDADGKLLGQSGRLLSINNEWKNPRRKFRLGLKRAFELYPRGLKDRVLEERKKSVSKCIKEIESQLQKSIAECSQSDEVEDLKTRLSQLRAMDKDFEDPGPVYDCLVFHDGERWQAVIDTSESGDLSAAQPLTDFHVAREFRRFSDVDALNYCVNIFDEGAILSVVVDAGAHGSHVAGIVAANYPEQPECSGVAPGAQIVSLKIGDTRLGSMETGVGLVRAITEAVKRGCHIINMSYGEATAQDNQGAFIKLADEMVKKHGVIFVCSAGNNGPAISTVGCPGGTSSSCIGVGALATESLMKAAYSMPQTLRETNYTWSSVGPCIDGDLGVDIIAPGGAVTSVPNWTLSKKQLMNGTSMSSPNATGCLALLLSAALQNGLKISPNRIRKAVTASAKILPNVHVLGQGYGLVQVSEAWEALKALQEDPWVDVPVSIAINSERFTRGIYLRQPDEAATANTFSVTATPEFHESAGPDLKIQYEVRLRLESSEPWVKAPEHVLLLQSGKQFAVQVDPRRLAPGLHVAFVRAYDESLPPERGPVFQVPVTVVKPELISPKTTTLELGDVQFDEGERRRWFLVPPHGCSVIEVKVVDSRSPSRAKEAQDDGDDEGAIDDANRTVVLHSLQVFRGVPYRDNEHERYIQLAPGKEFVTSWSVHEGVTMELTLARSWLAIGDTACTVTLNFRGVVCHPSSLVICGGQRVSELIRVESPIETADLSPTAKLDKWSSVIKPNALGKVLPLGERDVLLSGARMYQLVLEYEFEQTDASEVTPLWPGLQGVLYESEFGAQFFMIYDSKKKLLGTGDAFPKPVKVGKGKFVVRLQVRHSAPTVLETLADMPMLLERPVKGGGVSLNFFKTQSEALVGADKQTSRIVALGSSVCMFLREPSFDQLPKQATPGDFLTGSITFLKKGTSGAVDKPVPIKYLIGNTKAPSAASGGGASSGGGAGGGGGAVDKGSSAVVGALAGTGEEKEEKEESGLEAAVREAKVKYLKSLCGKDSFDGVLTTLVAEYPDNLPINQAAVAHALKAKAQAVTAHRKALIKVAPTVSTVESAPTPGSEAFSPSSDSSTSHSAAVHSCEAVVAAADEVVSKIDRTAIAVEMGTNVDTENKEAVAKRKETEGKKAALVEALGAKAGAVLDLLDIASNEEERQQLLGRFESDFKELQRWDDMGAEKHWLLNVRRLQIKGRWGAAMKKVNDLVAANADNKSREPLPREVLLEERDKCLQMLGWNHILDNSRKWTQLALSKDYDLF